MLVDTFITQTNSWFSQVKQFIINLILSFKIAISAQGSRVRIVIFGMSYTISLTSWQLTYVDTQSVVSAIRNLQSAQLGQCNLTLALSLSQNIFTTQSGEWRQLLFVITGSAVITSAQTGGVGIIPSDSWS